MNSNLTVFNNSQFGDIRVMVENGKDYFCGKDVATALGYADSVNAIKLHCRIDGVVKYHLIDNMGRKQQAKFIDEGNLYRLITHSKLPTAEKFESWVFDEVLPSIRKTGTYIAKPSDDLRSRMVANREENAKVRKAQLMYKLSMQVEVPTYKQVLQSHITELLTGEMLLPLPKLEQQTYSAEEIAERVGSSANMVGRMTNQHNLKTTEYGTWVWDKAKNCEKQVQTFRYYINVVDKLNQLFEEVA